MSDLDKELKIVRTELDELDERLVRLINDRARLVQRIGSAKALAGVRVYVPDRERQVLDRIRKLNPGPLDDRAVQLIYREVMSASLVLETSPRIASLEAMGVDDITTSTDADADGLPSQQDQCDNADAGEVDDYGCGFQPTFDVGYPGSGYTPEPVDDDLRLEHAGAGELIIPPDGRSHLAFDQVKWKCLILGRR